jgi:hypothetical protein
VAIPATCAGQVEYAKDLPGPGGLVARKADAQALPAQGGQAWPGVWVQVLLAEGLGLAARRSRSSVRWNPGRNTWNVSR